MSQPRIVAVQALEQWTGNVDKQDFLEVPATMDIASEEAAWFASGGDSSGKTFAEYLVSKGAKTLALETWTINYL